MSLSINIFTKFSVLLIFLFLVAIPDHISGDRTKAKIYINLLNARGCFRRMNSDGVVGCQSSFNGDVGVVHYVTTSADLDYVLTEGTTPPYVPVMTPRNFTRANALQLIKSHATGRVNGVLILGSDAEISDDANDAGFSTDAACPNRKFGLYADEDVESFYEWNRAGSGLLLESFPFPVFLISDEKDLSYVKKDCYDSYNDPELTKNKPEVTYPLCGIELHSFMYGSVSSQRCLRRSTKLDISAGTYDQQCDPLGDRNVFGFLLDPQSPPLATSSVVMVTARLDSTGFFEKKYPGADSPGSGIVALLATAHTLKKVSEKIEKSSKNVLFTLFNGESYDYLGSNRVVYDMTSANESVWPVAKDAHNHFAPLALDHMSHFLELSQFSSTNGASSSAKGAAYLFADKKSSSSSDELLQTVLNIGNSMSDLRVAKGGVDSLPPASLQQFLKAAKEKGRDLPGLVITEHKDHFTNKFYNSFLDVPAKIEDKEKLVGNLVSVATLTARSVLRLTTGSDDDQLKADADVVGALVHCYIYDTNCTLFKEVLNDPQNVDSIDAGKFDFSYYVGVLRSTNYYRLLSHLVLAHFVGDALPDVNRNNCTGDLNNWMLLGGNGSCVRAFVGSTEASSPAITPIAENLLFSYDEKKANSSAVWTESVWSPNTLTARIFLIPSTGRQAWILVIGIFEFLFFMALLYFVNERSEILFNLDKASDTQQVLTNAAGSMAG